MHDNKMRGTCLCGAVSLKSDNADSKISACHCGMCRTWGGGPYFGIDCGRELEIEGEEHVSIFRSSKWAERAFCRICGTHLFYRIKGSGHYAISAGLLEDQAKLELATQLFIDEKPEWYGFSNSTRSLTGEEVFRLYASSQPDFGSE